MKKTLLLCCVFGCLAKQVMAVDAAGQYSRIVNIGTEQASTDDDTVVKVNSWRSNVIRAHPYESTVKR